MNPKFQGVIPAPDWLKKKMEDLAKQPSPSKEEVEIQLKASERFNTIECKGRGQPPHTCVCSHLDDDYE